ncbi:MAG: hypothetical protein R3264_05220 [Anaerolineae bacterium]|nr:hypothetical protein [Anaerolineae bacterium]
MAEINWTVVTYLIVGVFALNGFFRGWWKEAITTIFLAFLVFLLRQPGVAEAVVNTFNSIFETIWALIPNSLAPYVDTIFEDILAVSSNGEPLQIDAGDGGTWLVILIIFLGVATLLSRSTLYGSRITPLGGVLGGLVGGLNGFIVINLVREYLRESNLPSTPASEIAGSQAGGIASSGVGFRAVNVPNISLLDSALPWIIIGAGVLFFFIVLNNRVSLRSDNKGFRKIEYRRPLGYRE